MQALSGCTGSSSDIIRGHFTEEWALKLRNSKILQKARLRKKLAGSPLFMQFISSLAPLHLSAETI